MSTTPSRALPVALVAAAGAAALLPDALAHGGLGPLVLGAVLVAPAAQRITAPARGHGGPPGPVWLTPLADHLAPLTVGAALGPALAGHGVAATLGALAAAVAAGPQLPLLVTPAAVAAALGLVTSLDADLSLLAARWSWRILSDAVVLGAVLAGLAAPGAWAPLTSPSDRDRPRLAAGLALLLTTLAAWATAAAWTPSFGSGLGAAPASLLLGLAALVALPHQLLRAAAATAAFAALGPDAAQWWLGAALPLALAGVLWGHGQRAASRPLRAAAVAVAAAGVMRWRPPADVAEALLVGSLTVLGVSALAVYAVLRELPAAASPRRAP